MTRSLVARADAARLPLAAESVDLVVTSPPYFGLRSYTDGGQPVPGQVGAEPTAAAYVDALLTVTRELARVLKPGGSLFVNLGDRYDRKSLSMLPARYAIGCTDQLGLLLRAEMIWDKPSALPEKGIDRVRRTHEAFLHLTKEPAYYCDAAALRKPHKAKWALGSKRLGARVALVPGHRPQNGLNTSTGHPDGAMPGSVWTIPTSPFTVPPHLDGIVHAAGFPTEWPRTLIAGFCPPEGVVLDPFGGTGTTALAAAVEGRRAVSFDLSADYCRLAAWRTTDPGQRAAAQGAVYDRTRAAEQDQIDLFAGTGVR